MPSRPSVEVPPHRPETSWAEPVGGVASFVRIRLVKSSDFVQETQPSFRIRFFAKMRSVAKRRDGGFRENSPRVFEIQKKRAGREAGVYDEYIIQNFVLRANLEANNYQYLT